MNIVTVGIDLAKNVFAVHGLDAAGMAVLVKPAVARGKLLELIAALPPRLVAMEACSGAHHWARLFQAQGHTVRLIAPDQTTVLRQSQVKFVLQDPSHNATNVTVFGQLKFEMEGVYFMELLVDDVMKLRFPIPLSVVKPPQGQAAPQA